MKVEVKLNAAAIKKIQEAAKAAAAEALEVTYTEPGVKGDTATNTLKRATVETGAEVFVPLFIETGEKIMVDTRTNKYSERVKE